MHPVLLTVHPEGLELPAIVLETIPDKLQPVAAHLSGNGSLCYAARGSIVPDVFDIAGQTLACLQRAEEVLGSLLRGEGVDDLEEEFFAYWRGGLCFLDVRPASNAVFAFVMARGGNTGGGFFTVTDDRTRTLHKLKILGTHWQNGAPMAIRRVKTQVNPRPLQGRWPPRTVSDLLHWQGVRDAACRRKLDEHITRAFKSGATELLCLVESPKLPYAFVVDFPKDAESSGQRTRDARASAYLANVTPVSCIRVDDEYIAQRNTPGQATLARRRIALVGCGTIGGFLGELLVKAGAGTAGGELALVDNEILLPQNIGRHRLGFNHVLQNKADALSDELCRSAPGATVRAMPVDAMEASLAGFELVINATGEEALGHLLTRKLMGVAFVPTLAIWIEGPGTAVRALLRETRSAACTRCLDSPTRRRLYPIVEGDVPLRLEGHGCESLYVPFPASVSVQAACLAMDMATAWANGVVSPRLRTWVLDGCFRQGAMDQDPPAQPSCPACRT